MKNYRSQGFLPVFRFVATSLCTGVIGLILWLALTGRVHPCPTGGLVDTFPFFMVYRDAIEHAIALKITGMDYTNYQARRMGLNHNGGAGFDPSLHHQIVSLPFCTASQTLQNWLNQECKLQRSLPASEYCSKTEIRLGCAPFQLSEIITKDPELNKTVGEALNDPGNYLPQPADLKISYGMFNLHAPGISTPPLYALDLLRYMSRNNMRMHIFQATNGIYIMKFTSDD